MKIVQSSQYVVPACGLIALLSVSTAADAAVINTAAESRVDKTQTGTPSVSVGSLAFGTGTNTEYRMLCL